MVFGQRGAGFGERIEGASQPSSRAKAAVCNRDGWHPGLVSAWEKKSPSTGQELRTLAELSAAREVVEVWPRPGASWLGVGVRAGLLVSARKSVRRSPSMSIAWAFFQALLETSPARHQGAE